MRAAGRARTVPERCGAYVCTPADVMVRVATTTERPWLQAAHEPAESRECAGEITLCLREVAFHRVGHRRKGRLERMRHGFRDALRDGDEVLAEVSERFQERAKRSREDMRHVIPQPAKVSGQE